MESECTGNCNRSNCGFLLDVNADANMVCVPVDDDMEGENVQLRRGVRERKRTSNGGVKNAKHVLCGHDGELRRYLYLDERGEWRRRTARSCFVCRLVVKNLDLHAVRSGRVCGRVR